MAQISRDTRIEDVEMSVRLRGICKMLGVDTIGELLDIPTDHLLGFRNIGRRSIAEIEDIRYDYNRARTS